MHRGVTSQQRPSGIRRGDGLSSPLDNARPITITFENYNLASAGVGGRWRTMYRAVLFLPVLMAPVVVAAVRHWILHPTHGVLNVALQEIFGVERIGFLRDSAIATWTIVGITGWQLLGFSVLIFSAR